jgi:hypothetical protein
MDAPLVRIGGTVLPAILALVPAPAAAPAHPLPSALAPGTDGMEAAASIAPL